METGMLPALFFCLCIEENDRAEWKQMEDAVHEKKRMERTEREDEISAMH